MRLTSLLAWIGRQATMLVGLVGLAAEFIWSILAAVGDVRTWVPHTAVQVRRIGVDSIPVALFIALFTGVVLALQSSYTFTGIVPLYFVGVLVGKSIMLELGPVLT
jgi:phospholipid/cholesterol/gamma-HCH transport system permease protein